MANLVPIILRSRWQQRWAAKASYPLYAWWQRAVACRTYISAAQDRRQLEVRGDGAPQFV